MLCATCGGGVAELSRMIEEDKQRQLAEMKGTLWGWMSGSGPTPPQAAEQTK